MGSHARDQMYRGSDVVARLYSADGRFLDLIEYDEVTIKHNLIVLKSEPLALAHETNDTHPNTVTVTLKGTRRSPAWLQEVKRQYKQAQNSGKRFDLYQCSITFIDRNTLLTDEFKLKDATLSEIDDFTSGSLSATQKEGCQLVGVDAST